MSHRRVRSGVGAANRRVPPSRVQQSRAAAAAAIAAAASGRVPPPRGLKRVGYISAANPLAAALNLLPEPTRKRAETPPGPPPHTARTAAAGRSKPKPARRAPPPSRGKYFMPPPRSLKGGYVSSANPLDQALNPQVVELQRRPRHPSADHPNPRPPPVRGPVVVKRDSGRRPPKVPPPRGLKGPYRNYTNPLDDALLVAPAPARPPPAHPKPASRAQRAQAAMRSKVPAPTSTPPTLPAAPATASARPATTRRAISVIRKAAAVTSSNAGQPGTLTPSAGQAGRASRIQQLRARQDAKQRAALEQAVAEATQAAVDLAEASAGGNGEWEAHFDDAAQDWYYHNAATGETTWETPVGFVHE